MMGRVGLIMVLIAVGLEAVACRSTPKPAPSVSRYIVTTAPIDVRVVSSRLCLAVDPTDAQGVWWWEPGRSGCTSRSTGPGVFRAEQGRVSTAGPNAIDVRFRLPRIVGPGSTAPDFADVSVLLQDGSMQILESGVRVPTVRRSDLDVPE